MRLVTDHILFEILFDSRFGMTFFTYFILLQKVSLVESTAYNNPQEFKSKYNEDLFTYERSNSFMSSHRRAGRKFLDRMGITKKFVKNNTELLELLRPHFSYLPIFSEEFSLESDVEPMRWVHIEFDIEGVHQLPDAKEVFFQVLIANEPSYTNTTLTDENIERNVRALCTSAERSKANLITLHTSGKFLEACSFNGASTIKFKSKLKIYYSIQDERLMVLEQFIRQFRLWEKYELG